MQKACRLSWLASFSPLWFFFGGLGRQCSSLQRWSVIVSGNAFARPSIFTHLRTSYATHLCNLLPLRGWPRLIVPFLESIPVLFTWHFHEFQCVLIPLSSVDFSDSSSVLWAFLPPQTYLVPYPVWCFTLYASAIRLGSSWKHTEGFAAKPTRLILLAARPRPGGVERLPTH